MLPSQSVAIETGKYCLLHDELSIKVYWNSTFDILSYIACRIEQLISSVHFYWIEIKNNEIKST